MNLGTENAGSSFERGGDFVVRLAFESESIVADFEEDLFLVGLKSGNDFAGSGVAQDVGEAFLVEEADVDATAG